MRSGGYSEHVGNTYEKSSLPNGTTPAVKAVKIREAAVLLGISENSVRRLIDREKLRTVRVLRHHIIPLEEINRLLS